MVSMTMQTSSCCQGKSAGFSLIEIMVGLVIALLATLVISQTHAVFEGQKRTTTAGVDAQENGLFALHTMETDLRMAGRGLIINGQLAMTKLNTYKNGALDKNAPMFPVMITDGGNGANNSDTIAVVYSNSPCAGTSMKLVKDMPTPSNVVTVNVASCTNANDMIILTTPGSGQPGALMQATGTHVQANGTNVLTNSGGSIYNPPGGQNPDLFPPGGFKVSPQAYVINMGEMVQSQYRVLCNTLAYTDLLTQTGAASCTNQNTLTNAAPVANNIVNIQAQYGVATSSGSQSVDCWVSANGSGCSPTNADWTASNLAENDVKRIKAVRIAVVARSSLSEKPSPMGCTTTTVAPVVWTDAGAPVVNLTGDADWQCYRYKIYHTIIPLRNVLWANI